MATKPKKRGRGRPKKGPIDLQAERARVAKTIKERRAERLGIDSVDAEEHCKSLDMLSHRNRLTKAEVNELRETSTALYEKFLDTQWEMEALRNERYIGAARAAAIDKALSNPDQQPSSFKPMSWEDWCKEHHLRPENGKGKPGPLKKKPKAIWDLEPAAKGTATDPSEPIDVDALEQKFMDEYIKDKENEQQFLKGKRLRPAVQSPTRRAPVQDFWR